MDRYSRGVALIRFEKHQPKLYLLDLEGATFSPAAWPAPWSGMRARFEARVRDAPVPLLGAAESTLLEFPLFGSGHGLCPGQEDLKPGHGPCKSLPPGTPEWSFPIPEEDWLVLELNTTFLSSAILHPLMAKHLCAQGSPGFDAKVVPRSAAPALPFIAIGPSFEKPRRNRRLAQPGRFSRPLRVGDSGAGTGISYICPCARGAGSRAAINLGGT